MAKKILKVKGVKHKVINITGAAGTVDTEVDTSVDLPVNIMVNQVLVRVNTGGALPTLDIGRLVGESGVRTDFGSNLNVDNAGTSVSASATVPMIIMSGDAVSVTYTWDDNHGVTFNIDIMIQYFDLPA